MIWNLFLLLYTHKLEIWILITTDDESLLTIYIKYKNQKKLNIQKLFHKQNMYV